MKEAPLDQAEFRRLAGRLNLLASRNGWPLVLLGIMGHERKTGVGVMRVYPHDPDFTEAVGLYPKVGAPLMAAALVYQTCQETTDAEA